MDVGYQRGGLQVVVKYSLFTVNSHDLMHL
jgi:hypothetical protein